jgi:putative hydrolase of the HAD superfamily
MTQISAVTFDAAETLFTPARPVGETYSVMARDFGGELDAERLQHGFRVEFAAMSPLGFPDCNPCELDSLEREWWHELVTRVVGHAGHVPRFNDYFDTVYDYYAGAQAWCLFPEVHKVLSELKARRIRLAVVSNFDSRLLPVLAGLDIASYFDDVVFSSLAGVAKPDPSIFELALSRLDVKPSAALHLGDNPVADRQGARDAGMQSVLVERAMPRKLADSVSSLDAILTRIGPGQGGAER